MIGELIRFLMLRALVVHSAEWTHVMRAAIDAANGRQAVGAMLHRYGFGVPALSRALRSANDALTLVSQAMIHTNAARVELRGY